MSTTGTGNRRAIQLPLGVGLRNGTTLDNFLSGPNEEAVGALTRLCAGSGERLTFLWGKAGTGKSHLLEAVCHSAAARGQRTVFLPFGEAADLQPELLASLEQFSIICIDDIDAIAGHGRWEQAAFNLYNLVEQWGGRLLVTARVPPHQAAFELADLASRLCVGLTIQLHSLDDNGRRAVYSSGRANAVLPCRMTWLSFCFGAVDATCTHCLTLWRGSTGTVSPNSGESPSPSCARSLTQIVELSWGRAREARQSLLAVYRARGTVALPPR